MNILLENGILNKMDCGNNFAYVVNDSNVFLPTEYKVLQSQADGLFVKCMKLLYNGKTQLYYLTKGYKSLVDIISTLNSENFMTIVTNLFAGIITIKNNGFLSCQNIDISFNHIFVEPATYKVSLVYLPLGKRLFHDASAFENELRTNLVKLIQSVSAISSSKVVQLEADLMNGMLSLENLYTKIRGVSATEIRENMGNTNGVSHNNAKLRLVATNASVPFEIAITKDEFILGKKQEIVDGVISFNSMISRSHCKIIRQGNQYAIVDLKSSNGTYLNKTCLQPNQPSPIKNGDMIRLANSEFRVIIG